VVRAVATGTADLTAPSVSAVGDATDSWPGLGTPASALPTTLAAVAGLARGAPAGATSARLVIPANPRSAATSAATGHRNPVRRAVATYPDIGAAPAARPSTVTSQSLSPRSPAIETTGPSGSGPARLPTSTADVHVQNLPRRDPKGDLGSPPSPREDELPLAATCPLEVDVDHGDPGWDRPLLACARARKDELP
jgi:hypothetical protein